MSHYKPYTAYKDSGVDWIGRVPAHWNVAPLGKLSVSRCDGPFGSGLKSEHYVSTGVRVIRLQNIGFASFKDDDAAFIDPDYWRDELSQGHEVLPGDVLIAGLGDDNNPLGRACVAPSSLGDALVKADCYRFRLGSTALPEFVALALSATARAECGYLATGATRDRLNLGLASARVIPLPPKAEQTSIFAALDRETARIDALIAKKTRFIELLKEKLQALITHAVTKGLDASAPMKDSGVEWIGEVPAHWSVSQMKFVARIGNGSTPSRDRPDYWENGTYPWLTSSCVNLEQVEGAKEFVTPIALNECHLPIVRPPAILVGITGQGRTRGMATTLCIEATINQHIAFLKANESLVRTNFLRRFIDVAYEWLRLDSEGAGSTKGAVTCEQIGSLPMVLPTAAEQVRVVAYANNMATRIDELASKTERSLTLLKERRAALITAAVTGQIDLREVA